MIVKRFKAENFRNIEKCDISFSEGINLLHGKNAEGKTNALEGIYIFSRGKSFRAADEKELIKNGADGFRISIEYRDSYEDASLEYALFGRERRRKKNGYKINKVTEMIGSFKTVLFSPDDLRIIDLASGKNFPTSERVVKLPSIPERNYPVTAGGVYAEFIARRLFDGGEAR